MEERSKLGAESATLPGISSSSVAFSLRYGIFAPHLPGTFPVAFGKLHFHGVAEDAFPVAAFDSILSVPGILELKSRENDNSVLTTLLHSIAKSLESSKSTVIYL